MNKTDILTYKSSFCRNVSSPLFLVISILTLPSCFKQNAESEISLIARHDIENRQLAEANENGEGYLNNAEPEHAQSEYRAPFSATSLPRHRFGAEPYTICNESDYKNVEIDPWNEEWPFSKVIIAKTSAATVQLQWLSYTDIELNGYKIESYDEGGVAGERWCTASMLDKKYQSRNDKIRFITAAHCFQSLEQGWKTPKTADGKKRTPPDVNATLMKINFWYHDRSDNSKTPDEFSIPIIELEEYGFREESRLDYAIFAVNKKDVPVPLHSVGIFANSTVAKKGKPVALVQHPGGARKVWSDDAVTGIHNEKNFDLLLYDNLNTESGASGSPLITETGELVGIHIKGADTTLKCEPGSGRQETSNKALSLKSIESVSKIL